MPAAAGTADPLAQDRPSDDDARFFPEQLTREVASLTGCPHQETDQRREQVRRNRQARALGDVVDLADDLQAMSRPDDSSEDFLKPFRGSLKRRRNQSRRDHSRLDQAEIVVAEVEEFLKTVDILAAVQVDAREPQQRFGDHADARFDRWLRMGVAAVDAEVDRDVENLRPLGIVHSQEENIRPGAMRKVEADGGPLDQDREERVVGRSLEKRLMKPNRMLVGSADTEHPAVSRAASDRLAHLVGQRFVADLFVSLGQGAGDCAVGGVGEHGFAETLDRLIEPPFHEILEAGERNQAGFANRRVLLQLVAKDRVQKHRGANTFVKIARGLTKSLKVGGRVEDRLKRRPLEQNSDGGIPNRGIRALDGLDQPGTKRGCHESVISK